jgi:hypothetical protein
MSAHCKEEHKFDLNETIKKLGSGLFTTTAPYLSGKMLIMVQMRTSLQSSS